MNASAYPITVSCTVCSVALISGQNPHVWLKTGEYKGSGPKKGIPLHAFHSTYVYLECYYTQCTVNLIRDTRLQFRMITGEQGNGITTLGVESQDQSCVQLSFPRL
jgi:hypothetical protein